MKKIFYAFWLFLFVFVNSCNKKENQPPPPKPKQTAPVKKVKPVKSAPPKKSEDQKRADKMVSLMERLNKCLKSSVDSFRKVLKLPSINKNQYLNMKRLPKMCEHSLMNIINMYPDLSVYYEKYFLLAASLLDTYFQSLEYYMLPPDVPGKIASSELEKRIVNAYNSFAVKNNELLGVPVLEKMPEKTVEKLDITTYADELGRLGKANWTIIKNWNSNHSFKAPPGEDRPVWMNKLRYQLVKIRLLEISASKNIASFKKFLCNNRFASAKNKVSFSEINKKHSGKIDKTSSKQPASDKNKKTSSKQPAFDKNKKTSSNKPSNTGSKPPSTLNCNILNARAELFITKSNAFFTSWRKNIKNAILSYPVLSKGFEASVSSAFNDIASVYKIIPKPIK